MEEDFDDRPWDSSDKDNESEGLEEMESPEQILADCAVKFATPDYIMEPGIFSQLKRYFQAGGNPLQVIEELSHNYTAVAQMANLVAEWLIIGGVKVQDVQAMVENHLKEMILKSFDPKKADTIFTEEGETPAWLTQLIEHPTWRSLIYRLAEEYPDCLMLNFTIKLISDAGFQGEITSISTAAQQLEVFSRVLKTSITSFLTSPEEWQSTSLECAKMVCHGQHTYVYSQLVIHILARENKGGSSMKRLSQEITKCAQKKTYNSPDPPPIDLIRTPQFLELLVDALFKPGVKLNPDHKPKYIHLLAYAASVSESGAKKGQRRICNKDELQPTVRAIETVHNICNGNKGSSELMAELATIYHSLRFLEMRKMVLDRMVNLLCSGCVVPVVKYIKQCWQRGDTDISLIRYFVTEVLDTIGPPYSSEFVHLFMPMVENDEITGTMRGDGENDPVSEFIVYCKANYTQMA
ncbi:hypothetical protein HUJ05_002593 [Dendroctonus ponderosae]|nr:hypothetical protein HUJ05_002593 [Dendroctonus ponderosae]